MADSNWERRRISASSSLSASSQPASINQRPRMPQDHYGDAAAHVSIPGMTRRNPFQNPSPSGSTYESQMSLQPPAAPFANSYRNSSSSAGSSKLDLDNASNSNLSVSYLPAKFSRPHSPGISYRKANKNRGDGGALRRGGGRDAFATGASRMPGAGDDDYDGIDPGGKQGTLRWNRFKWILFTTNSMLTLYSSACLVFVLLVWFNIWTNAEVMLVGNRPELIISTIAASVCIFTSLIGWAGILLNNRTFLGIYTLLLWVCFALLVTPGYITYKRRTFNLEGKINLEWSRYLGVNDRLVIQNVLSCCGYYNPFIEATVSARCYSRSSLPGCKGPYIEFEQSMLHKWFAVSFILVPFHLACIIAALLCSNHVTYRFGKGMMPKAYRLNSEAMAIIMESFASNLADQYNDDSRSESNLTYERDSYGYPPRSGSGGSSNSGHAMSPDGGAYGDNTRSESPGYYAPGTGGANGAYKQPHDKRR
ncbi:hypothetical protein FRB94_010679 [Tulasnella sp. JGI-2019a]|nr:hypothetical protein FRB94_010679 [Tulasnella sp. JGI-2019a]KAG8997716.1 hypothetical protein FRB93_013956 [Tulasnella sp. JGI-2019a]KAG9034922.1 hypothetical protein FRB95_012338 [Tulasnella sp. JGI-2019a]